MPSRATPEKILKAFNTWAFKREQPDSMPAMLEVISDAIAATRPIPFVLYWGKGPRSYIGEPELACLDYLATLASRVRQVYGPGARLTLIFTDTHAELNGHSAQSMWDYFDAVRSAAEARGFAYCRLGDLVRQAGVHDVAQHTLPEEIFQKLRLCAAKWFRGEGSLDEGADKYYRMNMIERRAVELAFPGSIFATFNGSEFRCLFPEKMPVFFMYSLRRGVSVKPWFMEAPAPALTECA